MDAFSVISPLVGVLIGGGLTWWGQVLRERKERKVAIGSALSDLLEVRHQIVAVDMFVRALRNEGVPEDGMPTLRTALEALVARNERLNDRYEKAISLLAAVDPILAFELRSKNQVPQFLTAWRSLAIQHGMNPADLERLESELRVVMTPLLNDAVTQLATSHSRRALREVRDIINKELVLPEDLRVLISRIKQQTTSKN